MSAGFGPLYHWSDRFCDGCGFRATRNWMLTPCGMLGHYCSNCLSGEQR